MLRIHSTRSGQQLQSVWRQSLFAIRHESTASTSSASEPVKTKEDKNTKPSLSERLGGSGRGKLMESSGQEQDVFASFLAQAQKKQQNQQQRSRNNTNNRQRRPNQGQHEAKPGQFDDAAEGTPAAEGKQTDKKQQQQRKPKQQQRQRQQQQQQQQQQQASGNKNNKRDRRPRQQQQDMKKSTSYGSTSTSGPTRRATTFIDKDIDWASLSPVESVIQEENEVASSSTEVGAINKEQLEKELNTGDYTRFMSMGESIQWPGTLDHRGLESLVGSNASYGLDAKMAFLATVAKASSVGGATVKK